MINVKPVILCGGSGTRLWPVSRVQYPKQFLNLFGSNSFFQQSVERLNNLPKENFSISETFIVAGEEHRFLVLDQMKDFSSLSYKLFLEPTGRNTAAALTLASMEAVKDDDDPILIVFPSDQSVKDTKKFCQIIEKGIKSASKGNIVIFGIKPSFPSSGYGYIKFDKLKGNNDDYGVLEFVEKPDENLAEEFIKSGNYLWNSGIFILKSSLWLKALKFFRKDIEIATRKAFLKSSKDLFFWRPDNELFKKIPNESIDTAVIEKCPDSDFSIRVLLLDAGWSDLGTWHSLWIEGKKNQEGNLIYGDVITSETTNSLIYSEKRLLSVVGLNNIAVIDTSDALLVADYHQSQKIKDLVVKFVNQGRDEAIFHKKVLRPWGWFDIIDVGDGFKVKRIQVNPGASLSLQKHFKRSEHWVVIKGTANVTLGNKNFLINENQSTYIPQGEKHRLANLEDSPLEIIEVQCGKLVTEDDIERYEDFYGRVNDD